MQFCLGPETWAMLGRSSSLCAYIQEPAKNWKCLFPEEFCLCVSWVHQSAHLEQKCWIHLLSQAWAHFLCWLSAYHEGCNQKCPSPTAPMYLCRRGPDGARFFFSWVIMWAEISEVSAPLMVLAGHRAMSTHKETQDIPTLQQSALCNLLWVKWVWNLFLLIKGFSELPYQTKRAFKVLHY